MTISKTLNNQLATQDLNVTGQLKIELDALVTLIDENSSNIDTQLFIAYLALSEQYANAFNSYLLGLQAHLLPCGITINATITSSNLINFYFYRTVISNSAINYGNLPWYYLGNFTLQPYFTLATTNFFNPSITANIAVALAMTPQNAGIITEANYSTEYPSFLNTTPQPGWQNYWLSQITQFANRVTNTNTLINTFKSTTV
jgi:hypothetical protein